MNFPFLSVIIPLYNCERYLSQCVHSVTSQPFCDLQIIIVNDGSTDNSLKIAEELAKNDSRIVVLSQKNQGVSAARNAGIDYAMKSGAKFLAFLDADDAWVPNSIDNALHTKICMSDDVEIWGLGSICANSTLSRFMPPFSYSSSVRAPGNQMIWKTRGTFGACLFSTALLSRYNLRFAVGLKYSEDKIFLLKCVFLSKLVEFVPNTMLYIYRGNENSAMSKIRSISPSEYYLPIINGWVAMDEEINNHEALSGLQCNAGKVLGGIYLLDMASDHFKQWRSKKALRLSYSQTKHFPLLKEMSPTAISETQNRNRSLLLSHPHLFSLKFRIIGCVEATLYFAFRFSFVRNLYHKKKYSLTEIPR